MSIILSYSRNISQWIHASSRALTPSWWKFLSHRNQPYDLFCKSMDWFLCNKDLRYEIFYLAFLSGMLTIHKTAGEGGGYLLMSFQPLPPASQTLRHYLGYCCKELTSAHNGIEHGTFVTRSLEFTLSTLALIAAVVRKMLKTRVTLGNTSLLLWQFSKSIWAPFHHKLAQHNFREFIYNFDARCVSRKFTTYSCQHLCQKWLLMRFFVSVVLERTVRFVITADFVLE